MPALPRSCYRTSHGYLFRVVVPESLRADLGKCEIKKSLGKDYRAAVSQAHLLALQVDRQFSELREQRTQQEQATDSLETFLATPPDKRLKPVTEITPELVAGLKSFWLSTLEADLAWRKQGLDDEDYDDLQENIAEVQQSISNVAIGNNFTKYSVQASLQELEKTVKSPPCDRRRVVLLWRTRLHDFSRMSQSKEATWRGVYQPAMARGTDVKRSDCRVRLKLNLPHEAASSQLNSVEKSYIRQLAQKLTCMCEL